MTRLYALSAILASALLFGAGTAAADCANPGAVEGVIIYNKDLCTIQFCNGTNWHLAAPPTCSGGSCSPMPPTSGLIAHWKLDENSGTTAYDNAGLNDGTLTDMDPATDWVAGKVGNALEFDGTDDHVLVGDVLDFGASDDFTISVWVYRDDTGRDDRVLWKKNSTNASDSGYLLYIDSGNDVRFFISDGTDQYFMQSTTDILSPGWHHFVIVWDDDSAAGTKMYIDAADDNASHTGTISAIDSPSNAVPLTIGAESDLGKFFDGKLDDVRIYDRALTAQEVQDLYDAGNNGCS